MIDFIMVNGGDIDRPFPVGNGSRSGCSPLMLAMEMSGGKMTGTVQVNQGK